MVLNPKVAIIEPVGGYGGMDYYDFGLCGGLGAADTDVVLYTCAETSMPADVKFQVRHFYSGIYGGSAWWLRGLRFVKGSVCAIFSAVRDARSIIHLHFYQVGILELINVLLSRLAGRKVVITAHDVESFAASLEIPAMGRIAYRLAHHVIVHNRSSLDELMTRLRIPQIKISVIPHGNYLHFLHPRPSPDAAKKKLGLPHDAKVLLFFGQIKDVKGLEILLNAMPKVLRELPNTVLIIAGRPWKTDFKKYQSMIDEMGINNACFVHERFIPDEEVPLFYGAADLVVLPYRRIYQSGALLMAMSYGKAVLVSDIKGMLDVVSDRVTGFVFRAGDIEDLADKLLSILINDNLLEKVALNGYKLMEQDYSWAAIGRRTTDVYNLLIR